MEMSLVVAGLEMSSAGMVEFSAAASTEVCGAADGPLDGPSASASETLVAAESSLRAVGETAITFPTVRASGTTSEEDGPGCRETGAAAQAWEQREVALDSVMETMQAREAALHLVLDSTPVLGLLLDLLMDLTRDLDSRLHRTIRKSFHGRKVVSPI